MGRGVENWITWSSALEEGGVAGEVASYTGVAPFRHTSWCSAWAHRVSGISPVGRRLLRLLRLLRGGQHFDYTKQMPMFVLR